MRLVREIAHPNYKITIFSWNNRYLIKLEQGMLEQTFKIPETDLSGDDDLNSILDAEFLHQASQRFKDMGQSLYEARMRSGLWIYPVVEIVLFWHPNASLGEEKQEQAI